MKVRIVFDEITEFNIELFKITEKKLENYVFDGVRDNNRTYKYYFLFREETGEFVDELRGIAENVSIKDYHIVSINSGIYCLVQLKGSNKYELDYIIDNYVDEHRSIYKNNIVQKSMKFELHLQDDKTELLGFLND